MFSLEYIKDKKSTSDFTKMIDQLVEKTKENQTFRGDYMAWDLAEQKAIDTAKKMLLKLIP